MSEDTLNPFGFDESWLPNRVAHEIIAEYLSRQPDQGSWDWVDHCLGLSAGILYALREQGRCVTYEQGRAHWLWNDELNCHIPCCSQLRSDGTWCCNGPLPDDRVPLGNCGEH